MKSQLPDVKLILCAPRGFCAGVVRAIETVEETLRRFGPPVYVRHEIVHNRYIVETLQRKGVIFVEELNEIPETTAPVIFSAHGVAQSVLEEARRRNFMTINATCPLVTKVHQEVKRHVEKNRHVFIIGHRGHPEVIGLQGQAPAHMLDLIETCDDVARTQTPQRETAYVTQTTLSVDETQRIIATLTARFPNVHAPLKEDLCYATTNRQNAVKSILRKIDALIVVGGENSSNSKRLCELAETEGRLSVLLLYPQQIPWSQFKDMRAIGVTAGASAPEILVQNIVAAFKNRFNVSIEFVETITENIVFAPPSALRASRKLQESKTPSSFTSLLSD